SARPGPARSPRAFSTEAACISRFLRAADNGGASSTDSPRKKSAFHSASIQRKCRRIIHWPASAQTNQHLRNSILPDRPIPETIDDVIVHHSNRLHVRINDRRAAEAESPGLEVLAECGGLG